MSQNKLMMLLFGATDMNHAVLYMCVTFLIGASIAVWQRWLFKRWNDK